MAWRRYQPRSYLRRRELPAALLRAAAFSLPCTWALMTAMLNEYGQLPSSMGWPVNAAVYACLLVFASGAVKVRGWGGLMGSIRAGMATCKTQLVSHKERSRK